MIYTLYDSATFWPTKSKTEWFCKEPWQWALQTIKENQTCRLTKFSIWNEINNLASEPQQNFLGLTHQYWMHFVHNHFLFFFCKDFFWCGPVLKSLLNLLQYCFCFIFRLACGILALWPGIKPSPSTLESIVLITQALGKSHLIPF